MMKKHWNRKGFTMAEVLIVVAIIVVLAGVGFIALMSHMRNMEKLELDGQAKEIFVAAQNHLALADSQGYLGRTGFGTKEDEDPEHDVYYYVVGIGTGATSLASESDILGLMLPFAAVDESARVSGSYIIRYEKSTATVLDVFYAKTTGRYKLATGLGTGDYTDEKLKGFINGSSVDLKNYGTSKAVVGYYGGVQAANLKKGDPLNAPGIQVINGDKLLVIVTDNNDSTSNIVDGHQTNLLSLTISGSTQYEFTLSPSAANASTTDRLEVDSTEKVYTITLDDLTVSGMHFSGLDNGFIPGEDITVQATAYNNTVITNVAESAQLTTNSLFESISDPKGANTVANIGYLRHFLNLDKDVSGLKEDNAYITVEKAVQTADLSWTDFKTNVKKTAPQIYATSATSAAGFFLPVNPVVTMAEYDGGNHKISDIAVNYSGKAGLFGTIDPRSSCNVHDLELVDFKIDTSGSAAGALAGEVKGSSTVISGILVHNSELNGEDSKSDYHITVSGSGTAGGLVGELKNGRVESCAAAVYVAADSGTAGGLIGKLDHGTVVRSYVGGHTEKARFVSVGTTTSHVTNTNVYSASGNAGGLIGAADGGTVKACYSTCSVASGATAASVCIGGLIGDASGVDIQYCYSGSLVERANSTSASKINAFVVASNETSATGCDFLTGVSGSAAQLVSLENVTGATYGQSDTLFDMGTLTLAPSAAYDQTLTVIFKGEYPFRTADMLAGLLPESDTVRGVSKSNITATHVGDWQKPSMIPLNYMLVNGNSLDLVVELLDDTQELTFAVTGETSGYTRVFTLKLSKGESAWTVTDAKMTAVGPGLTTSESIDVKDYFIGRAADATASPAVPAIAARFGAYKFDATAYPTLNAKYVDDSVFKGKRVYTVSGTSTVFYDVKISLDDITDANGNFAQLFASSTKFGENNAKENIYAQLYPGENITVRLAGGSVDWTELETIKGIDDPSMSQEKTQHLADVSKYSIPDEYHCCTSVDNSLFARPARANYLTTLSTMSTADIVNIRHLQNLDVHVSNLNSGITTAELKNDITWSSTWEDGTNTATVQTYSGAAEEGKFNGIYSPYLQTFNGGEHKIVNLAVGAAKASGDTAGLGNAGLFRLVTGSLTVNSLYLQGPTISTTTGYAGAFVAENRGTVTLNTVLAEGAEAGVDSLSAAGGLVGVSSGTSLTINNSASAIYVTAGTATGSGATYAGGLVAYISAGTADIKNSYVGGHTAEGAYYIAQSSKADAVTSTARWNIVSYNGAAGGIIGETASGSVAGMTKCFNTASVYSGVAQKAGSIIGNAQGTVGITEGSGGSATTRGIFDLVYTVAPVNSITVLDYDDTNRLVKTNKVSGDNGAAVGTLANTTTATSLFYLADIYDGARYNAAKTESTIKYVGSGTLANKLLNTKLAFYFAEKTDAYPHAVLLGKLYPADLVQVTSAYDSTLKEAGKVREYPFAIWTSLPASWTSSGSGSIREFFGDWQPAKNQDSIMFRFHFLVEDPANTVDAAGTIRAVVPFAGSTGSFQMGIQLEPFDEDQAILTIPTVPYVPGYDYGNGTEGEGNIVWTVYYGDQSDPDTGIPKHGETSDFNSFKLGTTYAAVGGEVKLKLPDLVKANTSGSNDLTFVAHYYKLPGCYTLLLKDYNPAGGTTAQYKSYGGIQLLDKDKTFKTALSDGSLHVPRRSRPDYRFAGWYTQADTLLADGTTTNSGSAVFVMGDDGKMKHVDEDTKPSSDMVLYAHYEKIETQTITINFALRKNSQESLLDAEYNVEVDKNFGLDEEFGLPYSDQHIKGIEVIDSEGTRLTAGTDYWFLPTGESVTEHTSIHIKHKPDTYPETYGYTVYVEGDINMKNYALVHVLEHSTKATNGTISYSSSDSAMAVHLVEKKQTPSNIYPEVGNADFKVIEGFTYRKTVDAIKGTASFNNLKSYLNNSSVSESEVDYIVVVYYSRVKYELSFDSLGGKEYYRPEKVEYGENISSYLTGKSPTYDNNAYTFQYWTMPNDTPTVADDAQVSAGQTMPAKNVKLTAYRVGNLVTYKVAFWCENPNDDGYAFVGMEDIPASTSGKWENYGRKAGQPVSSATFSGYKFNKRDEFDSKFTRHFTFNAAKAETVYVSADGTTVLNVYYTRNNVNIKFYATVHTDTREEANANYEDDDASNDRAYLDLTADHVHALIRIRQDGYAVKTKFTYTATDTTDEPRYGLVNGEYVPLERYEKSGSTKWVPEWVYTSTTNGYGELFGAVIVNDSNQKEYRFIQNLYYTEYGPNYMNYYAWGYYLDYGFTEVDGDYYYSGRWWDYYKQDGSDYIPVRVYYDYYNDNWRDANGNTYRHIYQPTGTGQGYYYPNSSDYDTANVARFVRVAGTDEYPGQRYIKSGNKYVATESDTDEPQYYFDGTAFVKLKKESSVVYGWKYRDANDQYAEYEGTLYIQNPGTRYNGAHLILEGGEYKPASAEGWTGADGQPAHYREDGNVEDSGVANGKHGHVELEYVRVDDYIWVYEDPNGAITYDGKKYTEYEGDDFTWFSEKSSASGTPAITWTGKWRSTFESNGLDWASVDAYAWHDGQYTQTYLYGFQVSNFDSSDDYNLRCTGLSGNSFIYHYRQTLNGDYDSSKAGVAKMTITNNTSFTFSDKYSAFSAFAYTKGNEGFKTNGKYDGYHYHYVKGTNGTGSFNSYTENSNYPLHIYHTRKKFTLTLYNGASEYAKYTTDVYYEQDIWDYLSHHDFERVSNVTTAPDLFKHKTKPLNNPTGYSADDGYKLRGWCLDSTMNGAVLVFKTGKDGKLYLEDEDGNRMIMPEGNLALYAKWARDDHTVTFNLKTGEETMGATVLSFTKAYNATLERDIGDENGILSTAYTPTSTTGKKFLYWYYTDAGTSSDNEADHHVFYLTEAITADLQLYAYFDNNLGAEKTVTINYYEVNSKNEIIKINGVDQTAQTAKTATYRPDANGNFVETGTDATKIREEDLLTFTAPNITGYYRVKLSQTIRVSATESENVINFYYRKSQWKYTVEYYVQYNSIDAADWAIQSLRSKTGNSSAEFTSGYSAAFKVYTDTDVDAYSLFTLFGYRKPVNTVSGTDTLAWLSKYRFDHYVYDDKTTYSNYVTIYQDATSHVLQVYLVPDSEEIEIDDIVTFYNGVSQTSYNLTQSQLDEILICPSGYTPSVTYEYYCYDATANDGKGGYVISDATHPVVDAGTYGVRAYLTVSNGGGTYLVWQSDNGSNLNKTDIPPLHLYVRRRLVIMKSGTQSRKYNGDVLTDSTVDTPTTLTVNGVEVNLSSFTGGMGFVNDSTHSIKEGADYVFSANSFRRIVGTTSNVFTYKLWDGNTAGKSLTKADNYNFFIYYGTLTVTN